MDPKNLQPGEGAVLHINGEDVCCYNDNGSIRAASALCTHANCMVEWNGETKTFDCPCHGSRFNNDFSVKDGPAEEPLEPRTV